MDSKQGVKQGEQATLQSDNEFSINLDGVFKETKGSSIVNKTQSYDAYNSERVVTEPR